jgi:biopolymer transport protein ExbB/TolQ
LDPIQLSWSRQDVEQRLGIPGGKHTRVNTWFTALLAVAITLITIGILLLFRNSFMAQMFLVRGMYVPYFIIFFTAWSFSVLFIKWRKLAYQRKAFRYLVVPQDTDFVLSSTTVADVLNKIYATVDDPKHFTLFNRIVVSLTNLRNLGRVSDVDDILRSQAEHDESAMETSYALLRSFVWAIPVLGFIGTVLGLSQAIGGFSSVLQASNDISNIKDALQGVTGGLATAFETTLQALVAALFIQLTLAFLKKSEEEFLDQCQEYCAKHVVNRLRIMPFEQVVEE